MAGSYGWAEDAEGKSETQSETSSIQKEHLVTVDPFMFIPRRSKDKLRRASPASAFACGRPRRSAPTVERRENSRDSGATRPARRACGCRTHAKSQPIARNMRDASLGVET